MDNNMLQEVYASLSAMKQFFARTIQPRSGTTESIAPNDSELAMLKRHATGITETSQYGQAYLLHTFCPSGLATIHARGGNNEVRPFAFN